MADQNTPSTAIPIKVVVTDQTGAFANPVTIADNGNAVEGALADAAITTNAAGSLSGKLRGIVTLLAAGIGVTLTSTTLTATVQPAGVATVSDNRLTVATAGTAQQFPNVAAKSVAVTAETDNTGTIVVGASTVVAAQATRRGLPLPPGDTAIFAVANTNELYIDTTVNTDGVTYVVLV